MAENTEFEKAMELWVASPSKIRLVVFFRRNPGLVDTLEGIARRLAMRPEDLSPEIRDHIELGILKERNLGEVTVYALDRERASQLEEMIQRTIAEREATR